jgi:2-oxoglutarate dehydrogenase E2 component (dihydrolipoamide succinyltransferase)
MQAIVVPTINNNDTEAKLVVWTKGDGETVQRGETIAVLETTKASFELAAETDGVLQIGAKPGEMCAFGSTIGRVFTDDAERANAATAPVAAEEGFVITQPARELAQRHGVSEEQLRALGLRIVKARDVEALVGAPASGAGLSEAQRGIARVVARSRAEIPDSFLVKRIAVDAALAALAEFSREAKVVAGLPDLLVWSIARLPEQFPFFFGALRDGLDFQPSAAAHLGVTFDLGSGLFIPVIRGAAQKALAQIAREMMAFRMKALRKSFRAEDLAGGDLSISLNFEPDTVFVQPIILPPQTCMVSVGAVLTELVLDAGQPVPRRYLHLGVAFDHRVINGSDANAFAAAIKRALEEPPHTSWTPDSAHS